ncbi:branched-chain amino acid aminotransferase [Candidatus Woesearchaeota archaeon]|nr:MAG: branched-chain amino acid aminotransferase [Candidatus Woesearchaeota archaeon]
MQAGEIMRIHVKNSYSVVNPKKAIDSFGTLTTPHMFTRVFGEDTWEDGWIDQRHSIELDPSAFVLHYAGNVFEGMKAIRTVDGNVNIIRPHEHAMRFNRSCDRMVAPEMPEPEFIEAIDALVHIDNGFVPDSNEGAYCYIRPNIIATTPALGLNPPAEFLFYIILSPSKPFFGANPAPQSLLAVDQARAHPGGTGQAKTGGNYAGSLLFKKRARDHGHIEALYIDQNQVTETGAANFYMIKDGVFITPPLNGFEGKSGVILQGITRKSILEILPDLNIPVSERAITLDELLTGITTGNVTEMGIMGTAAVIQPIKTIAYDRGTYTVASQQLGTITSAVRNHLLNIYRGIEEDKHNWLHPVTAASLSMVYQER